MKIIFAAIFCGFYLVSAAQDTTEIQPKRDFARNALSITLGKPRFTDAFIKKRNVSFSLNYQFRFLRSFSIEPFYLYAQNNSFPDFFENAVKLDKYIRGMEQPNIHHARWDDVYTHSLGLRLHFAFINNWRWYFTFNFAAGYSIHTSSVHSLAYYHYTFPPFEVTGYRTRYFENRNSNIFTMPGLLLNYNIADRFLIGIQLNGFFIRYQEFTLTPANMPVLPNHWNASLVFGKTF